jgi:rRNA maturation protein Nop10
MKPVPVRVKRMGIQQHIAVPDKFSAEDSQGKFVVEEDRNGEL